MSIKSLGRQSLIYGVGHVLSRIITFLLLPLYTHLFTPEEYGIISLAYAFMGMTLIFYRYGMDSALLKYSIAFKLPINFIIEINHKSVCTDTLKTWNMKSYSLIGKPNVIHYEYELPWPHAGAGKRVQF